MFNSKKAQISDTMSWIIATIIIVLILSIPILLVKLKVLTNEVSFDRMYDPIATKSISGYLLKNYGEILKLETEKKEPSAKSKEDIEVLLRSLCLNEIEGWNILFFVNEKEVYNRGFYKTAPMGYDIHSFNLGILSTGKKVFDNTFYFNRNSDKIVLEFYTQRGPSNV